LRASTETACDSFSPGAGAGIPGTALAAGESPDGVTSGAAGAAGCRFCWGLLVC
jgi:hypothetical protein